MSKLPLSPLRDNNLLRNFLNTGPSAVHGGKNETAMCYCEEFDSLTDIWDDNGLSKCFFYTLSSVLLVFFIAPVCMQIVKMKRFVFYFLVFCISK